MPTPTQSCIWGVGWLHWDVALYPKGTIYHIAPPVAHRLQLSSSRHTLGHP
jgi:hypothetical protein